MYTGGKTCTYTACTFMKPDWRKIALLGRPLATERLQPVIPLRREEKQCQEEAAARICLSISNIPKKRPGLRQTIFESQHHALRM